SCAVMRSIPQADYKEVDTARNKTYRLTKKDKRVYEFKEFAVTDSTLVILKVVSYRHKPFEMSAIPGSVVTPVVIPWDDVKSLERAERSNLLTALAITGGVAVVVGIVCIWVVGGALSGLGDLN
ncbi:MAG: hypothetical protein NTW97_10740, partial [Candidatus Krumholzibacteria bacterium]|nr:hypothetical protein [Candidatus Krumholzibacteria bacterium]